MKTAQFRWVGGMWAVGAFLFSLVTLSFAGSVRAEGAITFKPNAMTASVTGEVVETIKTYRFRAKKGERLVATLAPTGGDKAQLSMTIYAYCGEEYGIPLADSVLRWEGEMPCTDQFTIDVGPTEAAVKIAKPQRFSLVLARR